jgi:ABC-2 type transport system permease protein
MKLLGFDKSFVILLMDTMTNFFQNNYKWWYCVSYHAKRVSAGAFGTILQYTSNVFSTLAIVYVWYKTGAGSEIITYLTVGKVFQMLSSLSYFGRLSDLIATGKITNYLLLPQSFFKVELVNAVGVRVLKNVSGVIGALIGVIIAGYVFKPILAPNLGSILLLLLVFLPIAFVIQFLIGVIIGSTNFFVYNKRDFEGISSSYIAVLAILTGSIIPLNELFYPQFFQSLPFAWIIHHPMQIYLGNYSNLEILYSILSGVSWILVLYVLAKIIFKLGLKKNESVGL